MPNSPKECPEDAPDHSCEHAHGDSNGFDLLRIASTAVLIGLHWFVPLDSWTHAPVAYFAAVLICAFPIFAEAFTSLKQKRMTMSLSMTIAIVAALCLMETFTGLVITFFCLIAEQIEKFTTTRGRRTIKSMLDFLPATAFVRREGLIVEIEAEAIEPGDTVVAKPGSRIVVDGTVIAGQSFVDEASITGESLPVEKFPGRKVFAGSVNQSGALEIKAESLGKDTAFGRMVSAVEAAEKSRGNIQRISDKLAAWLVLISLITAAVTFFVTGDMHQAISVLIVAGACGIAAGTPLAIFSALGRSAHSGAIIKGGMYVEQLALVNTVVFDKSGTLTTGEPRVQKVQTPEGITADELLQSALSAEVLSQHPAARSIVDYATTRGLTPSAVCNFQYLAGRGISAVLGGELLLVGNRKLLAENGFVVSPEFLQDNGWTEVFVAHGKRFLGAIFVSDRIRPEAYEAIKELKGLGIQTMLLSGDTAGSAKRVAEQLGIPCFEGGMKPEDKQNRIKGLVANGRIVAMVGDGINDAPALISSSVGVAVGSGTDVAVESAAVVLLGSNLLKFVECIRIARQCRRIILSNFAITIVIDIAGMALAFFGLLPPVFAALVHAISEALCLFNSARLLPFDYARDALSKKRKHNNHSHSSTVHHTCNKNC